MPIHIAAGGELDGYVVQLQDVGFGYPGATPARLFQHCEFGITSKSRIVLLGENGNGKTVSKRPPLYSFYGYYILSNLTRFYNSDIGKIDHGRVTAV